MTPPHSLNKWPVLRRALAVSIACLVCSSILGGPLGILSRGERHVLLALITAFSFLMLAMDKSSDLAHFSRRHRVVYAPASCILFALLWILLPVADDVGTLRFALLDAQSLLMLPITTLVFLAMRRQPENLWPVLKLSIALSVVLAFVQTIVWLFLRLNPLPHTEIYNLVEAVFHTTESIAIIEQPSNEGSYWRVVWISSYWLIPAVFLTPVILKRFSAIFFAELFYGVAILASYTKGIWLALVIGVLFLLFLAVVPSPLHRRAQPLKSWLFASLGLTSSLLFVLILDGAQGNAQMLLARLYAPVASSQVVMSTPPSVKDESTTERVEQTKRLMEKWREKPILGHGFGAYVKTHFSHDERPFLYEMLPVALLMKLGAVGLSLYLLFLAFVIKRLYSLSKNDGFAHALSAAYLSFLVQVHTNPVFFSFTGMLIFSIILFCWLSLEVKAKQRSIAV